MNRLVTALAVLLGLWGAHVRAIDTEVPLEDPSREALYQNLIHETRCLVCQNQTIADSTAPLAADLRREIRRLVQEGKSEAEIETFLLDRYGDFALYKPRFTAATAMLWLAPALLLIAGALTLQRTIRRRRSLPSGIDADENPSPPESNAP